MNWGTEVDCGYDRPTERWLPLAAPESDSSYWVKLAQARSTANWARILEEWQLIPSEWSVLRELYRPGHRGTVELAQALGMSKAGMSKLMDRLVKRGYVRKEASEFDRRFRPLALTRYARQFVPRLASMQRSLDREFYAPLGNTRRFRFTQWLKQVLGPGCNRHMHQWVLDHLPKPTPPNPEDDLASAKRERAEYDAFSNYIEQIARESTLSFFQDI